MSLFQQTHGKCLPNMAGIWSWSRENGHIFNKRHVSLVLGLSAPAGHFKQIPTICFNG